MKYKNNTSVGNMTDLSQENLQIYIYIYKH